jgi:hypothetical protein
MARTETGRILTQQHHTAQAKVRARALRDYLRLWPIWEGDTESFNEMVAVAIVLTRAYHGLSATIAGSYFESFRRAEQVEGEAIPRPAAPVDEGKVRAGLIVTGRGAVADALRAGRSAEDARATALTRTSGSITRQVLTGGRETLLRSVAEDPAARGWARVTDDNPCAFCALLASRGPMYGQDTVDFEAHDHCDCTSEPVYDGSEWPGRSREFKALYNHATREARESGELRRGTSNDLLNAFRRHLSREGDLI